MTGIDPLLLFGGFTAEGFRPPKRDIADPAAFIFVLSSAGRADKFESAGTGKDLSYDPDASARFGDDLVICSDPVGSCMHPGKAYKWSPAVSKGSGSPGMMLRGRYGWRAAEVVAWVV